MRNPEPVRRTAEIEEVTNSYVIHPIAGRLTPLLARLGVAPNAVSLAGMACGLFAGIAYYHYRDFASSVAGLVLMIAWHVLDGADGQLARLTQRQSQSGKVLDGICDYVTFASVYVCLAMAMNRDHGSWVWGLVSLAGICHAAQAAAYEVQRQDYEFWGLGRQAASIPELGDAANHVAAGSFAKRLAGRLHALYGRLQIAATGTDAPLRRRLAAILAGTPERTDAARSWYRHVFAPSVRRWSILSANYRTLAIFLFCAAKAPVGYFVFEIVGLGGVLAVLLSAQPTRYAIFFSGLADREDAASRSAPDLKDRSLAS